MEKMDELWKGRGAQFNPANKFQKIAYVTEHIEGLDEPWLAEAPKMEYFIELPKKIVSKIDSPDLGAGYSMNPYQGCEHGCVYCFARNTHEYWGYGAGLDFESKIIIKENAPQVLAKQLESPKWEPKPIMMAGNTDCYQPIEAKKQITRKMLEVLLRYKHPVSLITKNSLILRDLDLLKKLNDLNLVHVSISITTLNEELRRQLEPRTVSGKKRLEVVKQLSDAGIPVNVMLAPIIPALNDYEIPELMKAIAEAGASSAAYTIVRLNGSIGKIFEDWVRKAYPDRADKVLYQIAHCHGGKLNDSRFGTRIIGEGNFASNIANLFRISKKKFLSGRKMKAYDFSHFRPMKGKQMSLF